MSTSLTVQIVTYNSSREIKECLKSLEKYEPSAEIIILDNNSSDNTRNILKKNKKIQLIEQDKNLGFGKAHNLLAVESTSDFICFLNPDTLLRTKNGLSVLCNILEENPEYGIIAPKLVNPTLEVQKSVRNLPTFTRAFKEYILGEKGVYDFYLPISNNLTEVESVVGACMVIRKELFLELGGFNEKYFMYYEDLDLCKKIQIAGYKIGYYPQVVVEHLLGRSGESKKASRFLNDSFWKYHGFFEGILLKILFDILRVRNLLLKVIK